MHILLLYIIQSYIYYLTITFQILFHFRLLQDIEWTSQVVLVVKNLPANAGDVDLIPGLGRFPGIGNGLCLCNFPLHYSCLENSMGRGN